MSRFLITTIAIIAFCNTNFAQQTHKEKSAPLLDQISKYNGTKPASEKLFGVPNPTDYKRLFAFSNTEKAKTQYRKMPRIIPRGDYFIDLHEVDTTKTYSLVIVRPE